MNEMFNKNDQFFFDLTKTNLTIFSGGGQNAIQLLIQELSKYFYSTNISTNPKLLFLILFYRKKKV